MPTKQPTAPDYGRVVSTRIKGDLRRFVEARAPRPSTVVMEALCLLKATTTTTKKTK